MGGSFASGGYGSFQSPAPPGVSPELWDWFQVSVWARILGENTDIFETLLLCLIICVFECFSSSIKFKPSWMYHSEFRDSEL